jgi:hypothetical protein
MRKTIGRNATRKIAEVRAKNLQCNAYNLGNSFIATECDPEFAWKRFETRDYSRLSVDENGKYTIRVHDNCWYELTENDEN